MKIFRYIAVVISFVLLFGSCSKEVCPVPFCTMTFNFSVESTLSDQTFPVEQLAVFLRNEVSQKVFGPIDIDLSQAVIVKGASAAGVTQYTCTVNQALPYGKYTMWLWGNVAEDKVYSFDSYSLCIYDDCEGGDYLLGKAHQVDFNTRQASTDIVLERLTAEVEIASDVPAGQATSLYVSDIYAKVNAAGVYSEPMTLEFEKGLSANVPPSKFYAFPTVAGVQTSKLNFSYTDGSVVTAEQSEKLEAGAHYLFTFNTVVP